VGLEKPNLSRAQRKDNYNNNCLVSMISDTIRKTNYDATPMRQEKLKAAQRPYSASTQIREKKQGQARKFDDLVRGMSSRDQY
jgi:hypothetical protein